MEDSLYQVLGSQTHIPSDNSTLGHIIDKTGEGIFIKLSTYNLTDIRPFYKLASWFSLQTEMDEINYRKFNVPLHGSVTILRSMGSEIRQVSIQTLLPPFTLV